jgi:hypothetical protein
MGHVEIGEKGRASLCLPIPQTITKKGHLKAEPLSPIRLQMAGVIPPFSLELRVRKMVLGKRYFSTREHNPVTKRGA